MAQSRIRDLWLNRDKTHSARYGIGMRWQAIWTAPGGKTRKQNFRTKDQAKAHLDNVATQRVTGENELRPDMLFSDYVTIWRSKQLHQRDGSLKTVDRNIKNHIMPAFKDITMRGISRIEIQQAITTWAENGLAPTTIKLAYTYLSGIMSEAVLDQMIRATPCIKIKLPAESEEKIDPLDAAQVQTIADTIHVTYRHAVIFAAATGLRPGEWRGLTADRVDLKRGLISVDRQYAGASARSPKFGPLKTKFSTRKIMVGPQTVELIRELVARPGPEGLIFHTFGSGITQTKMSAVWRTVRDKLPWAGSGWHQLRHHHASLLIAGGASPVAVAHRMGHKDATETLKTYSHLFPDDDSKLAAMVDGLVVFNSLPSDPRVTPRQ
ncbi:tyrosine-type recombinase/integrase [Paeniglutamicibacter gangotriensis]|uniref:Integrase (Phage-like protein) n=1 Tax=Paeniglutamicibacter gangotriensis Lz1y TaxID=1276920 RepID=M7N9C8_9MICC|nr:site-specific integrase [Paeniglutamicibacter gangotriensis]EMQ98389.1 integrase (phage-like protein) [Paeniglutamicibacter gangotriensis Lz1y]